MKLKVLLGLFGLLGLISSAVAEKKVEEKKGHDLNIIFKTKKLSVGVYFVGNATLHDEGLERPDYEILKSVIYQNNEWGSTSRFDHAFVVRGSDFKFRVKVVVSENKDKKTEGNKVTHPYELTIKNIAFRGDAVELKHGKSGYIWIDGGKQVTHATDPYHLFTLRDGDKDELLTIILKPPVDHDEL